MEENLNVEQLTNADPRTLCEKIVSILDEKKADDIKVLAVAEQTVLADYFVICTGTSTTQVKSLADEVDYKMGLAGVQTLRSEGLREGTWAILDYGCIMVHIFGRQTRDFYHLEKLWSDAENMDLGALIHE